MDAGIARSAARARSRGTNAVQSSGLRAQQVIELKGGDLFIGSIDAPSTVEPGQSFTVSLTVENGAYPVEGTDADCCGSFCNPISTNQWIFNGFEFSLTVDPTWTSTWEAANRECIGTTELGTTTKSYSQSFTAPQSAGTERIDVTLSLPGSGMSKSTSRSITIRGPGEECSTDFDCPSGQICDNGECIDDPSVECQVDSDCGAGEVCENGTCIEEAECSTDFDCPEGEVCDGGNCVPEQTDECQTDFDCPSGQVCENGSCVEDRTGGGTAQVTNVAIVPVTTNTLGTLAPGDVAAVEVTIENTSGDFADFRTTVSVGGGQIGEISLTTLPGSTITESLEFTVGDPGTYTAVAGNSSTSAEIGNNLAECQSNADCPSGQVCENGSCVDDGTGECQSDADCPSGQVCDNGTCIDDGTGQDCSFDADCPIGQVCENGTCVDDGTGNGDRGEAGDSCLTNVDCQEGLQCVDGTCQSPSGGGSTGLLLGGVVLVGAGLAFATTR